MNIPLDLRSMVRDSFELGKLFLNFLCFRQCSCLYKRILTWNLDIQNKQKGSWSTSSEMWGLESKPTLPPLADGIRGEKVWCENHWFRRSSRILSTLKSYSTSSLHQSLLKKHSSIIMNPCGSCRQVFSTGLNYIFTLVSFRSEYLEGRHLAFPLNNIIFPKSSKQGSCIWNSCM